MRNKVVVEDPAPLFLSSTLFCATTVDNCIEKRSPHTKQRQVDADQQPPGAQCHPGSTARRSMATNMASATTAPALRQLIRGEPPA